MGELANLQNQVRLPEDRPCRADELEAVKTFTYLKDQLVVTDPRKSSILMRWDSL